LGFSGGFLAMLYGGFGRYAKSVFVIKIPDVNQILMSIDAILERLILAPVSIKTIDNCFILSSSSTFF